MRNSLVVALVACHSLAAAADKPKRSTPAECEKKIRAAMKQAMSQAKKVEITIELEKDKIFLLPEIDKTRFKSISFQGIVVPKLEALGRGDSLHYPVLPEYLGKAKVVLKLVPDPGKKGKARVTIRIDVFETD